MSLYVAFGKTRDERWMGLSAAIGYPASLFTSGDPFEAASPEGAVRACYTSSIEHYKVIDFTEGDIFIFRAFKPEVPEVQIERVL